MTTAELIAREAVLDYPDNHRYDVAIMRPVGILAARMELLHLNAPVLFEKHGSLLDIGSNKGFISFDLRRCYDSITGYEPNRDICAFAEDVRRHIGADNIRFINADFEAIPLHQADVVFVGNVHHYLFRDDIRAGRAPLSFLDKLAALTGEHLILDGCFEGTDFAVSALARDEGWPDEVTAAYTLDGFTEKLDGFTLESFDFNGIGEGYSSRHTAVYRR